LRGARSLEQWRLVLVPATSLFILAISGALVGFLFNHWLLVWFIVPTIQFACFLWLTRRTLKNYLQLWQVIHSEGKPVNTEMLPVKGVCVVEKFKNAVAADGKIFLGDELVKQLSREELIAVTLHEEGHRKYKKKIFGGFLFLTCFILILCEFLLSDVLLLFLIPIYFVVTVLLCYYSEFKADDYVVEQGYATHLISALQKMRSWGCGAVHTPTHPAISWRINRVYKKLACKKQL